MLIPEDGHKHATQGYVPGEAGISPSYRNLYLGAIIKIMCTNVVVSVNKDSMSFIDSILSLRDGEISWRYVCG